MPALLGGPAKTPKIAAGARGAPCKPRRARVSIVTRAGGPGLEEAKLKDNAMRSRGVAPSSGVPLLESDPREFRRALSSNKMYNRRVLGDEVAVEQMENEGITVSTDGLVSKMKSNGYTHTEGNVTFTLAESYGFCWGVERSVQMAYEARRSFPEATIWITNEIIHNPTVNQRLKEMNVQFVQETDDGKDFSGVRKGDAVILPAFGESVHVMKFLADAGAHIVDTTCPWVSKVWNAVDRHAKKEHTSIIHGKWEHEETVATASFCKKYLVVKNDKEAEYVMDYILNGGDKAEFLAKFANAASIGFDPDTDLERIGVANQTTMLKGETEAIGKAFEQCMMRKHGVEHIKDHFMIADTICDATQERQDAMYDLVEQPLDMIFVVGGYNSSNTSHLQEIVELKGLPGYWVDTVDRLGEGSEMAHRTSWGEMRSTDGWLPEGKPVRIGVTSGASTPDRVVEDVLLKILKQANK